MNYACYKFCTHKNRKKYNTDEWMSIVWFCTMFIKLTRSYLIVNSTEFIFWLPATFSVYFSMIHYAETMNMVWPKNLGDDDSFEHLRNWYAHLFALIREQIMSVNNCKYAQYKCKCFDSFQITMICILHSLNRVNDESSPLMTTVESIKYFIFVWEVYNINALNT